MINLPILETETLRFPVFACIALVVNGRAGIKPQPMLSPPLSAIRDREERVSGLKVLHGRGGEGQNNTGHPVGAAYAPHCSMQTNAPKSSTAPSIPYHRDTGPRPLSDKEEVPSSKSRTWHWRQ